MSNRGSSAEAVELAQFTRIRLGAGTGGPLPDILALIESDGVNVALLSVPNGPAGLYARERDVPFVLVNADDSSVRQRFTLAHEFGHHLLGHGDICDIAIHLGSDDPRERAANVFAAEFLLPLVGVDAWFTAHQETNPTVEVLARLATAYGVSCHVALYRCDLAGKVGGQKSSLEAQLDCGDHLPFVRRMQAAVPKDSLSLLQGVTARVPAQMYDDAVQALQRGLLTIDQAADRVRMDPAALAHLLSLPTSQE